MKSNIVIKKEAFDHITWPKCVLFGKLPLNYNSSQVTICQLLNGLLNKLFGFKLMNYSYNVSKDD